MEHAVLWERLDPPGYDWCELRTEEAGWALEGAALFGHEGEPVRLDYHVRCDAEWRTRAAGVRGRIGRRSVAVQVQTDGEGRWWVDGRERPEVRGCLDVDLAFTPATNLLPIRRLSLATGREADVTAAWFSFPEFQPEPLTQRYRRTGERTCRYESDGGAFVRELTVDSMGFVRVYPGLWQAVAG